MDNEQVCGGVYARERDRWPRKRLRRRVRMSGQLSQQRASKEDA